MDGSQTRDFTYINDVVGANLELPESDVVDGEAVNIGSPNNIVIKTLAEEVRDQLAPGLELEFAGRYDADAEHRMPTRRRLPSCWGTSQTIRSVRALRSLSSGTRPIGSGMSRWCCRESEQGISPYGQSMARSIGPDPVTVGNGPSRLTEHCLEASPALLVADERLKYLLEPSDTGDGSDTLVQNIESTGNQATLL